MRRINKNFELGKCLTDEELIKKLKNYYTPRNSRQNSLVNALIRIVINRPNDEDNINVDYKRRNVEAIARDFLK